MNKTDEQLIIASNNGDAAACEALLDRYKGMAAVKARALFLIGGDRDDLIQEAMIGLYKAIRSFREDQGASFKTFASICIDRHLSTVLRNNNTGKNSPLNNYISLDANDDSAAKLVSVGESRDPAETFLEQESAKGLLDMLYARLSTFEQDVLREYLRDSDYTAVAERLGKSQKSVDNALQRIKKKLKEII